MIPLSSNRASIARLASALDIFVRIASAAVSSALFTLSPCEGLGCEVGVRKTLGIAPLSGPECEKIRTKPRQYGIRPWKSARYRRFHDPYTSHPPTPLSGRYDRLTVPDAKGTCPLETGNPCKLGVWQLHWDLATRELKAAPRKACGR